MGMPHQVKGVSISSLLLVGWLSAVSFAVHAASPADPATPGYMGAVPWKFFLVGLPGLFVGSALGPMFNRLLGTRMVTWLFVGFLVADVIEQCLILSNVIHLDIPCAPTTLSVGSVPVNASATTPGTSALLHAASRGAVATATSASSGSSGAGALVPPLTL